MLDLIFVAVFQAAAGTPQPAAEAAAATAVESESVRERRERHALRCRDRTVMGTRIQQRVCMSRAQEEDMQRTSRDIAEEMHRSGPLRGDFGPGQLQPCQGRNC
ncbi:MAG: hypothetical protein AB7P07_11250 [Hyphomonadaceae bacterium]